MAERAGLRGIGARRHARRRFYDNAITGVLSAWAYCAFTLVDGLFIAHYVGESGLAGIVLAVPLLCFPYALSAMVGVGASTMISHALSVGRSDQASAILTQAVVLSIAGGTVLAGAIHIAAPFLISAGGEYSKMHEDAVRYVRLCGYFSPFVIVAYATEFFLRIEGAGRYGLYCMLAAAVSNIALDCFFVGVLRAGLEGAAIATGICHVALALAMLWRYVMRPRALFLSWAGMRAGRFMRRIAYYGAADGMTDIAPAVSIGIFNAVIYARLGASGMSAYAIIEYIALFATLTITAIVQGMQPLVSFHQGGGRVDLAEAVIKSCARWVVGYAGGITAIMIVAPGAIGRLFQIGNPDVIAMLHIALPCYGLAVVPAAVTQIITGYLTAVALPMLSLLIAVLRHWVVILAMLWCLPGWLGNTGIWLSMALTEALILPVALALLGMQRRRARRRASATLPST